MRREQLVSLLPLAFAFLASCDAERIPSSPRASTHASFNAFANSEWSTPVHLDAPISSPSRELSARLTPDELSLYITSDRPGTLGDVDIWAARRDCLDCPWGTPVNLGPNINSAQSDGGPTFSVDGHAMFFASSRAPGTFGGDDVLVSFREDANDDLSWEPGINLGPEVNTAGHEGSPTYNPVLGAGGGTLYFVRGANLAADIYQVDMNLAGEVTGPATPVAELNSTSSDNEPAISANGKEVYFWSARAGGIGGTDLWVASRQSPHDRWSTPQNVGSVINTPGAELGPGLSRDGRTLLWAAGMTARPSLGRQDIWMSTRTPSGKE